ncbi:ABC transporter permease [Hominifimenecus sp. rT4P-3]|uniref:ABC transporter permease n=1 Tax=Hominifimenecus sp. rT4P-3 TaxID=3242979 RepID=UPI003DA3CAF2
MKRLSRNRLAMVGLVILIVITLAAVFAPLLTKYSYETQDWAAAFSAPSKEHWLGTDDLGRDIFSRLLYGARYSLTIGIASVGSAAVIGIALGSLAGYYGGKLDMILMRITDIFQAIPSMLLAIAISAALGPGFSKCIIAIAIARIPGFARMTRASFLNVLGTDYIEAAKSINAKDWFIIVRHVLPNAMSPIIVLATMGVATAILVAASLSFIGLGVQPPEPEWGAILSSGRSYIRDCWWMVTFPGVAIMLTTLSLNLLGDGLRDALDPRLKK